MLFEELLAYSENVHASLCNVAFSDGYQKKLPADYALKQMRDMLEAIGDFDRKVMFIGNGGSAAIASHMAQDFTKIGGIRALSFNDGSLITCFANDFGFEKLFEKAIEFYAKKEDMVIAISSSGESADIINGVHAAKECGCSVITLTGFNAGNRLSLLGDMNVRVKSDVYGIVETAHALFLHAVLDVLSK